MKDKEITEWLMANKLMNCEISFEKCLKLITCNL